MKKITMLILLLTITTASAWEINTHRAIDRIAIEKSENLKSFVGNASIKDIRYRSEVFEGYTNKITRRPITYF